MVNEPIQLMIFDVVQELLVKAREAKVRAERSQSDFDKGQHFAFYDIISLLVQQSNAFGIDLSMVGLEGLDPERDILGNSD